MAGAIYFYCSETNHEGRTMRISDDLYSVSSPDFFSFFSEKICSDERLIYSVNYNTSIRLWNVI